MLFFFWFIPTVLALFFLFWLFFRKIKDQGGSGVRTDGILLFDRAAKAKPKAKAKKA